VIQPMPNNPMHFAELACPLVQEEEHDPHNWIAQLSDPADVLHRWCSGTRIVKVELLPGEKDVVLFLRDLLRRHS